MKVFNKAVKYLEDQSDAVIMHSEIEAHKLGLIMFRTPCIQSSMQKKIPMKSNNTI